MGGVGRQIKRMEMELQASGLTEDNYREILVRLPVKDVARCGTVCKAWRRITTDQGFLTDNGRRQPAEVLLYRYVYRQLPLHEWSSKGRWVVDIVLDAIHVSGNLESRRSVIRYHKPQNGGWLLLAVCEGVLLLKKGDGQYNLCNPTTRMWADLTGIHPTELTQPTDLVVHYPEYAFYFHQQSSEYRLLCRQNWTIDRKWCILSTGEAEPRNIDTEAADAAGITMFVPCLLKAVTVPLALHDNLHWPPQPSSTTGQTNMVVFNILSETFTQMDGPPTTTADNDHVKLFIMDELLVGAEFRQEKSIDLWFLENYGNAARWELRHRVAAPWGPYCSGRLSQPLSVAAVADEQGNVLLGNSHSLVVYNVNKAQKIKTINSVEMPDNKNVVVSRHVFRANLMHHPHFYTRPATDIPFVHF